MIGPRVSGSICMIGPRVSGFSTGSEHTAMVGVRVCSHAGPISRPYRRKVRRGGRPGGRCSRSAGPAHPPRSIARRPRGWWCPPRTAGTCP
eukprot:8688227-Pyramimonas_sp.AAC.1